MSFDAMAVVNAVEENPIERYNAMIKIEEQQRSFLANRT